MSVCRSCGTPLVWYPTGSGRQMPLEPDPDGNIVIRDGLAVMLPTAWKAADEPRFVSHFAHCPQANQWRRRNGVPR